MVMSIKEISDRFEINDLLVRYCTAVDTRNFDLFDDIFTLDAIIENTSLDGSAPIPDEDILSPEQIV